MEKPRLEVMKSISWKFSLAVLFFVVFLSVNISAAANPATVYCNEMGYESQTEKSALGEQGICVVDGEKFDAWDFLEGRVGKEYSYCVKNGYDIETKKIGNAYSSEGAVCVPKKSTYRNILGALRLYSAPAEEEIPMIDLMGLDEKFGGNEEADIFDFDEPAGASRSVSSEPAGATNLPAYFDWRDNNGNWMTPVKDQGGCNSCTVFSALGVVEAVEKITSGNANSNPDFSEQELISCQTRNICADGGYLSNALNYILNNGVVEESVFPYTATDSQCNIPSGADKYFIEGWENIDDSTWYNKDHLIQTTLIKQALIENGPLGTKIYMDNLNDPKNNIYRCGEYPFDHPHQVVIVGYKDTGNLSTSYWIVKNSWGNSWGDNGYFKVGWEGEYPGGLVYDECGMNLFEIPKIVTTFQTCISHAYSECSEGSVYWYDSCGNREEIKEECSDGCNAGKCVVNCDAEITQVDYAYFVGGGENVQVVGEYAYLGDSCFTSIDISDVNNINSLDSVCGDGRAFNLRVDGNYAYASQEEYGLVVIDVSDSENLEVVGNYDDNPERAFLKRMNGIDSQGNYIYIANHGEGLKIIDVSDKTNPVKVGELNDGNGFAQDVQIVGNYAYVADTWGGLDIIDISNKINPMKVGGLNSIENAMDVYVEGDYAYIADWGNGLKIVDISDVNNPELVGEFSTGGYSNEGFASGVYVENDYAYIASYKQGLFVVDVSNKANPVKVANYKSGGVYRGVYVSGNYVYLAKNNYEGEEGKGFEIVSVEFPSCGAVPSGSSSPVIFEDIVNGPAGAPYVWNIPDEGEQSSDEAAGSSENIGNNLGNNLELNKDNGNNQRKGSSGGRNRRSDKDVQRIDLRFESEDDTEIESDSSPAPIKLIQLNRNTNSKKGFLEIIFDLLKKLGF